MTTTPKHGWLSLLTLSTVLCFVSAFSQTDLPENIDAVTAKEIIASVRATQLEDFENIAGKLKNERLALGTSLIAVLADRRALNLTRCAAAYYLGELRLQNAAPALLANLTLKFDASHIIVKHLIQIDILGNPAADALVKIGAPAVPNLIQNLEANDDTDIRRLSLGALCRIEGDKGVVRFRLETQAAAESDFQKQARLQQCLKMLAEINL
jgi:PBS lyase HEAT-like repeat